MTRRFPPGARAAEARPPTTGRPGWSWSRRARKASAGKLNGSGISSRALGFSGISSGQPVNAGPSGVAWTVRWKGVIGPVLPAHRATAGDSSTSQLPPTTDTAAHPRRAPGDSVAMMAGAAASRAAEWGGVTNSRARSGGPSSASITCPTTSPTAVARSGCCDRAAANVAALTPRRAGGSAARSRDRHRRGGRRPGSSRSPRRSRLPLTSRRPNLPGTTFTGWTLRATCSPVASLNSTSSVEVPSRRLGSARRPPGGG